MNKMESGCCSNSHMNCDACGIKHVGAGFMPAFKFQQRFVLVIERGRKARAYMLYSNAISFGRVEMWRGEGRRSLSVSVPFV